MQRHLKKLQWFPEWANLKPFFSKVIFFSSKCPLVIGQMFVYYRAKIRFLTRNQLTPHLNYLLYLHSSRPIHESRDNLILRNTFFAHLQGSISPTFYAQLLRQKSCASKVQTYDISKKKLHAQLTYVKAVHWTLVKLTPNGFHYLREYWSTRE